MIERDDNFVSLGFTTPEQLAELRSREATKSIAKAANIPKPVRVARRSGNQRDYESDRDHPETADLPADFIDDDDSEPLPAGLGRIKARVAARRAKIDFIITSCNGDEALARARVAAYIAQHGEIE